MRIPFIVLAVGLTAGCRDNSIQSYRVPKEAPSTGSGSVSLPVPVEPDASAPALPFRWTVPASWKTRPASALRAASLLFEDPQAGQADISVVALAGDAGGLLANVNRWRGQIELPPLADTELARVVEKRSFGPFAADWVEFLDAPSGKAAAAAVITRGGRSWFFKLTGDASAVRLAKPSFGRFLQSLRSNEYK